MKSILVLAHSPNIGGAELALKALINSLGDTYRWTVVIPGRKPPDNQIVSRNTRYVNIPSLPPWSYKAFKSPPDIEKNALTESLAGLEALAAEADLLLTNTMMMPWLGFIAQKINRPHIWYIHEYGDLDLHSLQFMMGYHETLRIIGDCSSRILTISRGVKDHLSKVIPSCQIDLIHQSIDFAAFADITPFRFAGELKLVCMGAVKPSKGQMIALEAVEKLPAGARVKLDIVGPSADKEYARLLMEKAGKLDNVEVAVRRYDPVYELSNHDVMLMCSQHEGLGRVTLEGLASGRLVVGYGCQSTGELLADHRGIVYTPNTPESLSSTLLAVLSNHKTIDPEKNRAFVRQNFSDEVQARDFQNCVEKAIKTAVNNTHSLERYLDTIEQRRLWKPKSTFLYRIKKMIRTRLVNRRQS